MIKVLIADDHPIIRRGLREILDDEKDLKTECEASNAEEIIDNLRKHEIDVILLDISMPGKSGLDLISDITSGFKKTQILILSGMAEELFARRALKAGASGFLNKESAPEQLVKAIRKVHSGKKFISERLAEMMADDMINEGNIKTHEKLSEREFEVLRLIGSGRSPGEIADTLHLSLSTVSTYRARILEKLKLKNNAELIQYCINENLLNSQNIRSQNI